MTELKPFDALATCLKCGADNPTVTYHEGGCGCGRCHAHECKGGSEDHLVRHCVRCHFEWIEAPIPVLQSFPQGESNVTKA